MSFAFSYNGEDYHGDFATREDALHEAIAEESLAPGSKVYTGLKITRTADSYAPTGDAIVESMAEAAYDDFAEHVEDWPRCTDEQTAELGAAIKEVVRAWAEKHSHKPSWFTVCNEQEHIVPPGQEV